MSNDTYADSGRTPDGGTDAAPATQGISEAAKQAAGKFGEPWFPRHPLGGFEIYPDSITRKPMATFTDGEKCERAIDCVNACAGMEDPCAEISAMSSVTASLQAERDMALDEAKQARASRHAQEQLAKVGFAKWKETEAALREQVEALTRDRDVLNAACDAHVSVEISLRERLAAAEKDKERLDWLEKDGSLTKLWNSSVHMKEWEPTEWDIRAAIDAATSAQPGSKTT